MDYLFVATISIPITNRNVYVNFASYHAPQTKYTQSKQHMLFLSSVYTIITRIICINKNT